MIAKNGVLIGQFTDPTPILDAIPHAKYVRYKGKELVLVPHKLDEVHVLRNLGIDAPSPILDRYDWPGMWKPMSHQYTTAAFLTLERRAFCFNEMRTGKTSAALWAADYLMNIGKIDEVFVLCPLTVMEVWSREAFRTVPHRAVAELSGTRAKKIRLLNSGASIKVINFDGLAALKKECAIRYANKRVLIIVDECATYRTHTSRRYKALKMIITPKTWLWMMTGTPLPNAPTDAWAQAKLVNPKAVPPSFKLFQETIMKPAGPYKWVPKPGAEQLAYQALQPAIRFLRKDCMDIPEVIYDERHVTMSPEQQRAFDDFKKRMRYQDKENNVDIPVANAAVRLIKLQQVMCGVVKDQNGDPVLLDHESRMEALTELVNENNGKAIIFCPFKMPLQLIKTHFQKLGRTIDVVDGDVSKSRRNEIFAKFQSGELDLLAAHPATCSLGLDLSASSCIIWYAPTFSMEFYDQANARIQGPNQKEACGIYHIGCHPIEWAIYDVVRKKMNMSAAVLALYQQFVAEAP